MKYFSIIAVLLLATSAVSATTIHECEDEQGKRSFQKHCPPGSQSVAEKTYSGRAGAAGTEQTLPALVLYAVPDCEVCEQVKKHLSTRNIPHTELNIKDNGALQQQLKAKTGGDLRVPVLLIGDKVLSGYNSESLSSALTEAGYKAEESDHQ